MSGTYDERPRWPERDLNRDVQDRPPDPEPEYEPQPESEPPPDPPLPPPETEASEPTTSLGDPAGPDHPADPADPEDPADPSDPAGPPDSPDHDGWDSRRDGDRRRPTTAEQAVPWLIGVVLALTGIVVVLLALIFVGPEGVAGIPTPSPSASAEPTPTPTPAASPTAVPTEGPTPSPPPVFGALDMTYLDRAKANSPIRLSRHDFSTTAASTVLFEDAAGVGHYAWAPDGRVGVAIAAGRAVALVEGQPARPLTDPVDAVIFSEDSSTLYGLRIAPDGVNDRAEVLTIDFVTGATQILTTITYPRPDIVAESALKEAQFADDGGISRLYATVDGFVVAWIVGAPATYQVDPESGAYTAGPKGSAGLPVLWSPDQRTRIDLVVTSGATTLTLVGQDAVAQASVKVTGLVSHVRWAGSNNEIVFTLGRTIGGGVRQDLYVWDLVDGKAPSPMTSNGASFGAEWLGVLQAWK